MLATVNELSCAKCQGTGIVGTVKAGWEADGSWRTNDFGACPVCRPNAALERLIAYSELTPGYVFDTFEVRQGAKEAFGAAKDFTEGTSGNAGLTLVGQVGNGKTHLLQAIGWAMLARLYKVKYVYVPDLLEKLRGTYEAEAQESFAHVWDSYDRADVLLLDDLKDTPVPTPWARGHMERLIDKRYRSGELYVVATNLTRDAMVEVWGDRIADRVFDEGTGKVRLVYNLASSYRTGKK